MESVKKDISLFFNHRNGSGKCRGWQISDYINAKNNPKDGYENDVCIWVKRNPKYLAVLPKHTYIDIVDGEALFAWIEDHPDVGVIASSTSAKQFLDEHFALKDLPNEIVLIPHHHCNYERDKNPIRKVKTVGFIGCTGGYQNLPKSLPEDLAKVGLDFKYKVRYRGREDVCEFLKSIDIQVCYRNFEKMTKRNKRMHAHSYIKNPLKLANGGSFGIPTVAFPEINYKADFDGCFVEVTKEADIVKECKRLKDDQKHYNNISNKAMEKAEEFHIENIAPLYHLLGENK